MPDLTSQFWISAAETLADKARNELKAEDVFGDGIIESVLVTVGFDPVDARNFQKLYDDMKPDSFTGRLLISPFLILILVGSAMSGTAGALSEKAAWGTRSRIKSLLLSPADYTVASWRGGDAGVIANEMQSLGLSAERTLMLDRVHSLQYSPDEVAELFRRAVIKPIEADELMRRHGVAKGFSEGHYAELAKRLADPAALDEALRRKVISGKTHQTALERLGYRGDDLKVLLNQHLRLIDVGTAQEALRRGLMDSAAFKAAVGRLGYDLGSTDTLAALSARLAEPGQVLESLRRGNITLQAAKATLGQHGFSDAAQTMMAALTEQIPDFGLAVDLLRRGRYTEPDFRRTLGRQGFKPDMIEKLRELADRPLDPLTSERAWLRGLIAEQRHNENLRAAGLNAETSSTHKALAFQLPPPQDLIRFLVREVFNPDIVARFGQDQDFPADAVPRFKEIGLSEQTARQYWAAHWDLPSPGQGFEMFHRGVITADDLQVLLKALDVMPFWRGKLTQIAYNILPRRVLAQLVQEELIDEAGTTRVHTDLGFRPEDAARMTELVFKRADFAARNRVRTDVQRAFVQGLIDDGDFQALLKQVGFGPNRIAFALTEAKADKALQPLVEEKEANDGEINRQREVTKADVLAAFRSGLLAAGEAKDFLVSLEFGGETADFLVESETHRRIVEEKTFLARQIKRRFDAHLLDRQGAEKLLLDVGYAAPETLRLTKLWVAERDADDALNRKRERMPSRTDLNDWLKKSVIDATTWANYMARLGYGDAEIGFYLEEFLVDNDLVEQYAQDVDPSQVET